MKTFFREYFYVPKDGRIKDQVMMAHVIFTTVFILLCLLAMVVTAYSHAMFHLRVESEENIIKGASFDAEFYVERTSLDLIELEEAEEGEEPEVEETEDLAFVEVDDHVFEVTFATPGSYYIEVSALGSAQNGFCVFEVACDDPAYDAVYYTPSLSNYGTGLSVLQFYFDVTTPATVTATSYLGTIFDYEEFEDVDMTLIFDGDAVPIGEPVFISEEDMIDDPELLEELFGEEFIDDEGAETEPEEDTSDFFGGSGGGGFVPSDDVDGSDSSTDDSGSDSAPSDSSDNGSDSAPSDSSDNGSDSTPSDSSDSGSDSAPSGGSDSGSDSAPSGGSDGGSDSAPSGGSDSGSSSAPSSSSDGGSGSAPSSSSDSGSGSAPSGGSDGGSSSAPSGGSDSGSSSGGGDSASAGE